MNSVSYSINQGGEYINPNTSEIVEATDFFLGVVYFRNIELFSPPRKMSVEKFTQTYEEFVVTPYI